MFYRNAQSRKSRSLRISDITFAAFVLRIAAHHPAVPAPIGKNRAYKQVGQAVSHNADNGENQHRRRHRHTYIAA